MQLGFEPGRYYVRYAEDGNHPSSAETEVAIAEPQGCVLGFAVLRYDDAWCDSIAKRKTGGRTERANHVVVKIAYDSKTLPIAK